MLILAAVMIGCPFLLGFSLIQGRPACHYTRNGELSVLLKITIYKNVFFTRFYLKSDEFLSFAILITYPSALEVYKKNLFHYLCDVNRYLMELVWTWSPSSLQFTICQFCQTRLTSHTSTRLWTWASSTLAVRRWVERPLLSTMTMTAVSR